MDELINSNQLITTFYYEFKSFIGRDNIMTSLIALRAIKSVTFENAI